MKWPCDTQEDRYAESVFELNNWMISETEMANIN